MKKIVRNKLFEDPDTSYAKDNHPLNWYGRRAYPFGVNVMRSEVKVGSEQETHDTVGASSGFAYSDYAGRIWPLDGVIAFWEAPTKTLLLHIFNKLIQDPKLEQFDIKPDEIHDFLFDIPNPDQTSDDEDAIYTYSEYPENPKITVKDQNFDVKLKRPQHTVSPLKKKKEDQPKVTGGGSYKYAKEKPLAWRQAMYASESLIKPILNETPDTVYNLEKNWVLTHNTQNSYPFSFYENKAFIGPESSTHGSLKKYMTPEQNKKYGGNFRTIWDYPGRIWVNQKVISFWNYPKTKKQLMDLLEILQDKAWRQGIPLDPFNEGGWMIEILHPDYIDIRKLIPLENYTESEDVPEKEIEQEHNLSPLQKTKKEVPKGVGSKRYGERKPLAWRQKLVPESLDEAMVGHAPIADTQAYMGQMAKGVNDKIDFISKINPGCILDFGCADGYILNAIHQKYPDIKGLVGYDLDEEMVKRVKSKYPYIDVTDNWNEAIYMATEYEDIALSLMSVIHEVYSYGSPQTIHTFWRKQVFNPNFKYVVIRDMMPSKEYMHEKPSKEDIRKLKQRLWRQRKYRKSFEKQWGQITDNMLNMLHWLLKYDYKSNWGREVKENYLPVSVETIKSKIPSNWNIIYEDYYIFPPVAEKIKRDYGIELKHPTHMKMIIENKNYAS